MGEQVKYIKEFHLEALQLAREPDQSVPEVARDLGISHSSLYGWIRQGKEVGERAFPVKELTSEQAELKRLRRELEIACQEHDVLKQPWRVLVETAPVWGLAASSAWKNERVRVHRSSPRRELYLGVVCRLLGMTRVSYFTPISSVGNQWPAQEQRVSVFG